MARRTEHAPGETAPTAGTYELLSVFGSPTGVRVDLQHGHPMPEAPRGHTWTLVETTNGHEH
jgi:hypothetical protein